MRPAIVEFLGPTLGWLVPRPGLMYAIALVAVTWVFVRRARAIGLDGQRALEMAFAGAVAGMIGTRFFYLATTGELLRLEPSHWFGLSQGTASWGAYLGAIAGGVLYTSLARIPTWPYLDTAAAAAPLGPFMARWSCFLAGDDFGRVSGVVWAVRYPGGSLPWQTHVAGGDLPATAGASLAVHPFQLYLMLNAGLVFLLLTAVWRRWRLHPGVTFASFLVLYGASRFPWEFLRDPSAGGRAPGDLLSVSQWMCLLMVAAGSVLLLRRWPRGQLAESEPTDLRPAG